MSIQYNSFKIQIPILADGGSSAYNGSYESNQDVKSNLPYKVNISIVKTFSYICIHIIIIIYNFHLYK